MRIASCSLPLFRKHYHVLLSAVAPTGFCELNIATTRITTAILLEIGGVTLPSAVDSIHAVVCAQTFQCVHGAPVSNRASQKVAFTPIDP